MYNKPEGGFSEKALKNLTNAWKVWQLISPNRYIKYNLRNLTGDADHLLAGNPGAFKKVSQAIKELYDITFADRSTTPALKKWIELGGMQTLLQVQEISDVNQLKMLRHLGAGAKNKPNIINKYWSAARTTTDFREAILRYACFLDYYEQIVEGEGTPKNYGASIPEEVNSIKDYWEKAFKLSNELLGAYDDISVAGQYIRERLIPFYSWMEVNATIYKRLVANAVRDDELMRKIGGRAAGNKNLSRFMVVRLGKAIFKIAAFTSLIQAINLIFFPELEEQLPRYARIRPHIILGKDKNGNIIYFSRIGALGDLLEWFGLDTLGPDVKDILNGRKTIKEQIEDMVMAPIDKVINSASPFAKLALEMATGVSVYPELRKPKSIRDRGEYLANSIGIADEYRFVFGKPQRPIGDILKRKVVYLADPRESSYYEILDAKRQFRKNVLHEDTTGFWMNPRSNALYYYKMSLRYGDERAAVRYPENTVCLAVLLMD